MKKTATLENMTEVHLAQLIQMAKFLIGKGHLTEKEAEITIGRIASENELPLIYI